MALPVSPDPTDRRAAVVRMLTASPDGLSDADLARELGAGTRVQTVNQLCRRMAAEGELERVGTRPILNRLLAAPAVEPAPRGRRTRRKADPEPDASDTGASVAVETVPAEPAPEPEPDPDLRPDASE